MDRTPYLIAWYIAADESGASSLDQEGIKKLTAYNENLFFRILSAHIAQNKDKSIAESNKYIKLCLQKIVGGNGVTTTTSSTSPSAQTGRQQGVPQTGTTGAIEAERRKNLMGGFRPKGFGGFPTSASTPYNAPPPPPDRETRSRRPEVRSERTQTVEPEPEEEAMDLGLDDVEMEPQAYPYHNMGPRDPEVQRWNRALDGALRNINDQLQDAGVQVDLVERGRTLGTQADSDRGRTLGIQADQERGRTMGAQTDYDRGQDSGVQTDMSLRDLGLRHDVGTQDQHFRDASTSVEIGHLPNNQATFSIQDYDLGRVGELATGSLDYLPEPSPLTVVIDRDVAGERQTIDTPHLLGDSEIDPLIARVDAPISYDVEPERMEAILNAIPPPAENVDDIQITSSLEPDFPLEEDLYMNVIPQPGESESEAVERVVRPIVEDYNQTPPSSTVRLKIASTRRQQRLANWRATHPPKPIKPIHLEPGLEVRKVAFPPSGGEELEVHLHPPSAGIGTAADPFIHADSEILRESRSDPLETSHIVFEPNVHLESLPRSHTQPREVIYHIPGPRGMKLIRPTTLKRLHQRSTRARPNDDDNEDGGVRIFRKEHLPTNEVELVLNPAPNTDPSTDDVLTEEDREREIRKRQIRERRIRASNNRADALYRILLENNTPTGRALVPGVKYITPKGVFHGPPLVRPVVEIVAPTKEDVNIAPQGFFDADLRTKLLRAHILQRNLYPVKKLLAEQRRLAEEFAADGHPVENAAPNVSSSEDLLAALKKPKTAVVDVMRKLETKYLTEPEPFISPEEFEATAKRLEKEYQERKQRKGKGTFDRIGKGLAIHHAAKTIFNTLMNPSTSDERFNLNVRMLNQVTKHWPPQPAHDTVTNWSEIFAQNPRGQTLSVDPYERQMKINSLFKLVYGSKNKLYPYVNRERRGAGSKHHAREPHIVCPDESAKHYRDRRTLGKERLSRILPTECFYHPIYSFGGEFLNQVC